ncbi:hypothetical protein FACS189431_1430 [Alphaproteobacteria bacterium]|nr:hypothetical protein FACS189431_1430 [Alphaproteobacteria bacterium]
MKIYQQEQIDEVVAALNACAVVTVPTETVYGLAVKYDNVAAIDKLMRIKDRDYDSGKVFTLMLSDADQIKDFAVLDDLARKIAEKYFPGELTLVLSKNPKLHNPYFDHFDTIGIRIPNHRFMLNLLVKSGPLIVTSANLAGLNPAVDSGAISGTVPGIDAVVAGWAGEHAPSTVAKVQGERVTILRQGDLKIS